MASRRLPPLVRGTRPAGSAPEYLPGEAPLHHAHDHGHQAHDHGHAGHGHHDHGPGPHAHGAGERALGQALVLNGGFLVVELAGGWWTGSLALLSDGAHMVSDVGALAIALGAARVARRAAGPDATFGLRRAEVVGAALNGLALLGATGAITVEAVHRLVAGPPEVAGAPMLAVAALGLAINLGSAAALWRAGGEDLNVRAALAHMLADALGSAGAMVAAVAVLAGHPVADPVVSVFVAALVGWGGVDVLRRAGRILLELPPAGFDVAGVDAAIRGAGAAGVHDLRVWSIDGHTPIVSAHLVVPDDADLDAARRAAAAAVRALGARDVTLQVERASGGPCCG